MATIVFHVFMKILYVSLYIPAETADKQVSASTNNVKTYSRKDILTNICKERTSVAKNNLICSFCYLK